MIVIQGGVVGAEVALTSSTKIYDSIENKIIYETVLPSSVLVPDSTPFNKEISTISLIIIKKVSVETKAKIPINQILKNQ